MYDLDLKRIKKNYKKTNTFSYVFLFVGIFILLLGIGVVFFLNSLNKPYNKEILSYRVSFETKGTGDEVMYSPIYYYRVNGVDYSCKSNVESNYKPSLKNDIVYYDASNPSLCATAYSIRFTKIFYVLFIIPIIFILIGAINIKKSNKKIKEILNLNNTGKLIKGIPYTLINTNIMVNNKPLKKILVEYQISSGTTLNLVSEPRSDKRMLEHDGTVDIVIDESNPENYYIDFGINRIGGNRSSDYFKNKDSGEWGVF